MQTVDCNSPAKQLTANLGAILCKVHNDNSVPCNRTVGCNSPTPLWESKLVDGMLFKAIVRSWDRFLEPFLHPKTSHAF